MVFNIVKQGLLASEPVYDLWLKTLSDVDMGHTSVTPLGLAHRPTHEFDTGKALSRREGKHVVEFELRQYGADKSKLHNALFIEPLDPCAKF